VIALFRHLIYHKPKTTKSKFVMKKLLLVFGVAVAVSPFVSCKKMKDDIKDLKNQVTDLKKENDTLKNKVGGVEDLIFSDPISATTTFQDSTGGTKTVSGVYNLMSSDFYSQRLVKNADNTTYSVYVSRAGDMGWDNGASIEFTYNPTTKAVTKVGGSHSWADADPYGNWVEYNPTDSYYTNPGLTMTVTVDSLNLTTGATSIKFAAAGNSTWTNSSSGWYSPMHGKPVATTLNFVGKLKLYSAAK
jgi:hypothetical protein